MPPGSVAGATVLEEDRRDVAGEGDLAAGERRMGHQERERQERSDTAMWSLDE